jgi:hypothetical protein
MAPLNTKPPGPEGSEGARGSPSRQVLGLSRAPAYDDDDLLHGMSVAPGRSGHQIWGPNIPICPQMPHRRDTFPTVEPRTNLTYTKLLGALMSDSSASARRAWVAGGATFATAALTLSLIPFASTASAATWQERTVSSSDERISDVVTTPAGTTYVVWVDGTSVKVSSKTSGNWSAPQTILSSASTQEVRDVDIAATDSSVMVTLIEDLGTRDQLRSVRYADGSWSSPTTVKSHSSGNTPLRNADLVSHRGTYYVSVEVFDRNNPDGNPSVIYTADFYKTTGATNTWNTIADLQADNVRDGQLVSSGPGYLAFGWLDGTLAKIEFYEINGNDWVNPRTLNTVASPAAYISLAGSSSRSASDKTGVVAYDRTSNNTSAFYASLLEDDDAGPSRSLQGSRDRLSGIDTTWSSSADRAGAVYSTRVHTVYGVTWSGTATSPTRTEMSTGASAVRELAIGTNGSSSSFTAAWQEGSTSAGQLTVQRYSSGSWQAATTSLGGGRYPMIAGSTTPTVLAWGLSSPYALTSYSYEDAPDPDPTPTPTPTPGTPTVMIEGTRQAGAPARVSITGETTDIAMGATITTYAKKAKRGAQFSQRGGTKTLSGGTTAQGSFALSFKASKKSKWKVKVTVGSTTSNTVTIPKG